MRERLAGYLAVLGLPGSSGNARLVAGQFHDVVLVGEVAYRFPRDEESRRRLPAAVALLAALGRAGLAVPVPLGTGYIRSPLGRCRVPLTRLPGEPLGRVSGRRAEEAVVTELAGLLDRLAELGSDQAIQALVPRAGADHWAAFAGRVRHVLYPLMSGPGRRRADAELAAVTTVTPTGGALVHSDLGGANLLWTTAAGVPKLTGVLDWDQACIGGQAPTLPRSPPPSAGHSPSASTPAAAAAAPAPCWRTPRSSLPRSPSSRRCPPPSTKIRPASTTGCAGTGNSAPPTAQGLRPGGAHLTPQTTPARRHVAPRPRRPEDQIWHTPGNQAPAA